ncbi:MAG: hypothetical protein GY929_19865 [Actinomycetia bacterium]|nr:hypothetical protein [Actinomycetes bacterium]
MTRVIGLNARNAYINSRSSRRAILDARDKIVTKRVLTAASVPVPPSLAVLETSRKASQFQWRAALPSAWVMKPSRGSRGRGVLVVNGCLDTSTWQLAGGQATAGELTDHAIQIIEGEHSCEDDHALIEPLLRPHPELVALCPRGLCDVRVIFDGARPLAAMLRSPTDASGGRSNLHQGGLGLAVDLATGVVWRAHFAGQEISNHPDTGTPLLGYKVPQWSAILEAGSRCSGATRLGYLGVDIVVDEDLGPVVLEVNSHPGLEIQNVARLGLGHWL